MRKVLVLRSGGTDLPPEAAAPDVTLLTTHEIVPVPAGITEALAFDPRGARLVVSSKATVRILLGGTKEEADGGHGALSDAGAEANSTGFFEGGFIEVVAVGEETAREVRWVQSSSKEWAGNRATSPPPVVVPSIPGAAGVLHLLRGFPGGLSGLRILWPRGSDADVAPVEELRRLGADAVAPVVYEKRPRSFPSFTSSERAILSGFLSGAFGAVAVGSLAALDAFLAALGGPKSGSLPPVRWGVLGPETARAFTARGFPPPVVPARARFADLIERLRTEMESPTS